MAVQPLAAQVGVAPACQALGVSRASFYRRQRSTPGRQQPRPTPARALCEAEREQILDVLAGPRFVDRAPAEVVATLLDEGPYLCSERTMYRILAADQPVRERRNQREHPQYTKPRAGGHGAEPDLVLGHHQAVGADQVDVLLPLRRARHLQPLRGRLDGRRPGELGAGLSSHRRDLPQPGRPAPGAHPALRPRRADDEQVHRTTARRPRRDPFTEPPSGVRRQPLLRGAVQDPEVPPRLPGPLPRHHRRRSPSAERSSLGTTPNIAMAGSRCSPRTTCITIEPRACWSSAGGPFKPPGPVIPDASFEGSHNRILFPKPSGSTHL